MASQHNTPERDMSMMAPDVYGQDVVSDCERSAWRHRPLENGIQ